MELSVIKQTGEDTGRKVSLNEEIFAIQPNDHAIYLDVKQYLANQRQGTHKSKQRAEISGSTRKIKKQKGTGTARAGSIKSGVFKGGGRMFGPQPRDYSFKLNKKVKVLARKSAIAYKAIDNQIAIIEDFKFESAKTKGFVSLLASLEMTDKKALFILPADNKNIVLASRNLKKVRVVAADQVNTYDVLHADQIILSESSIEVLSNLLN
jgi:large subunit ribosomal protein L4